MECLLPHWHTLALTYAFTGWITQYYNTANIRIIAGACIYTHLAGQNIYIRKCVRNTQLLALPPLIDPLTTDSGAFVYSLNVYRAEKAHLAQLFFATSCVILHSFLVQRGVSAYAIQSIWMCNSNVNRTERVGTRFDGRRRPHAARPQHRTTEEKNKNKIRLFTTTLTMMVNMYFLLSSSVLHSAVCYVMRASVWHRQLI